MSRFEAWLIHLSNLLVGVTGLVYAWMAYLAKPSDPFSVVNHPLQPQAQHAHVLVAPLLVFAAGVIWRRHVWSHWKRGLRQRRRSGLSMMLTLVPMVASGYLIQTAVDERWRGIWVAVHLATSAIWVTAYVVHQVISWGSRTSDTRSEAADRFRSPGTRVPTASVSGIPGASAPPAGRG